MRRKVSTTTVIALSGALLLSACNGADRTAAAQRAGSASTVKAAAPAAAAPATAPAIVSLRTAPAATPPATTASLTRDILKKVGTPKTPAIKGFTAADTKSVVRWLAGYLARIHGDRATMCATDDVQTATEDIASVDLRVILRTIEGRARAKGLAPRLPNDGADCTGTVWTAPGVVVGPQQITLSPGTGGSLVDLTYKGDLGYSLRDRAGNDSLLLARYAVRYEVGRSTSGRGLWQLEDVPVMTWGVGFGWPTGTPLPHGFASNVRPPKPLPGADTSSLHAVTSAVARTLSAPAANWTETESGRSGSKKYRNVWKGTFALARGDGVIPRSKVNGRSFDEEIFDHGRTDLSPAVYKLAARPGDTIPTAATWTSFDPTARLTSGAEEFDTSPFVNLAVLALASSATKTPCAAVDTTARATKCFVARTQAAAAAYSGGLATRYGWAGLARSDLWFDTTVGVDAQGRLVSMHRHQALSYLGHPTGDAEVTGTFTGFAQTPPAAAEHPVASSIARDGTYYESE